MTNNNIIVKELSEKIYKIVGKDVASIIGSRLYNILEKYNIEVKSKDIIKREWVFSKSVNMYLVDKSIGSVSDGTIRQYRMVLNEFFNIVMKQPEDISKNDISGFIFIYKNTHTGVNGKVSNRTTEMKRVVINDYFIWCFNNRVINSNPCINIPRIS